MSSEDFPFALMDLEQAQAEQYNKQWFYSTREIAFSPVPSYSLVPAAGQARSSGSSSCVFHWGAGWHFLGQPAWHFQWKKTGKRLVPLPRAIASDDELDCA